MTALARALWWLATLAQAAAPVPPPADTEPPPDRLFDTELPGTVGFRRLQLDLQPQWGDLVERDVFRVPAEVSWGFRPRAEARLGVAPFVDNPFRGEGSSGAGGLTLGSEFGFTTGAERRTDMSVGARIFQPVGSPPPSVSDGYARLTPFISFAQRRPHDDRLRVFTTARYAFVEEPWLLEAPDRPRPRATLSVDPGAYLQAERWRYSLELPVRTDLVDGGERTTILLEPGVSYRTAPGFGRRAMLRDRLEVGLSLRLGLRDADDDISVVGRIRVRLDTRRMLNRMRGDTGNAGSRGPERKEGSGGPRW